MGHFSFRDTVSCGQFLLKKIQSMVERVEFR